MNRVLKVATLMFAFATAALWFFPRRIAAPSSVRAPSWQLDRAALARWLISSTSSTTDKDDGTWIIRRGLANNACMSFESRNFPGDFLRHQNFQVFRQPNDGSTLFRADATFCPQAGRSGTGTSFASFNFPDRFLRHFNKTLFIASNGGSHNFDSTASWAADVSWVVSSPWTP